jgi:MOSC domain-containing protein YiiM
LTRDQLDAGLDAVREAPADEGALRLIVARPEREQRRLLEAGTLEVGGGLTEDMWSRRSSSTTVDGGPNPEAEVTVMNARSTALLAHEPEPGERWAEAGDQLYVDFDISEANLPPGARFAVGDAVLEVTDTPHTGCGKFIKRYGVEAQKFVNSPEGRALRLRGVNTRVVVPGNVAVGDAVRKV